MSDIDDIKHELSEVKDKLSGLGSGIADAFSSLGKAISNIFSSIRMIAGAIAYGIINFVTNIKNALVSFAYALWKGVKKVAEVLLDAINWIYEKIVEFFKWFVDKIYGIIDGIINTVMSAYNWIKFKISSISQGFAEFVGSAIEHIALASREKIVLMTSVNFAIIGMYKGLDLISDGKIGRGLLSIFLSPIAGAISGRLLDALLPNPTSIQTPFLFRGVIPQETKKEGTRIKNTNIIHSTERLLLGSDANVKILKPLKLNTSCPMSIKCDALVSKSNSKLLNEPVTIKLETYARVTKSRNKVIRVTKPLNIYSYVRITFESSGGYYYYGY